VSVPYWWEALLLTLAAWRLFHLLAFDDILDRPRRYVTRLSPGWKREGDATGEQYRETLAMFITCPYCAGFWISAVIWILWLIFPTETVWLAVPLAVNAGLIGAQRLLSSE
jgi:hypothetical protein